MHKKERLQKVIAHSGYTSRRKAEQMITEGRVKVNQKVVAELGTKVGPNDQVEVDDIPIEKEEPVYLLLYKPRGIISSVKDDKGRKVVTDLISEEIEERLFPVGRLDYDTSGLILLTNDGEFSQKLIHPKFKINKVYVAKVNGIPSKQEIYELQKGVHQDGEYLRCVNSRMLKIDKKKGKSIIELTLREGKNRQVRRMFDSLGYRVEKLKRERFGSLTLGNLNPGEYRELTPHEVKQLLDIAEKNVK
ncbi:pseudouridine synthase [Tenuibacillus multivorans]|uniref:Pseudouridine synthase n=1 Tax=Tenuibacillus multivorans TaxID=237069 RepID=A0A1H0CY76_9BACI|nr:pseudouridine synthase [Tenuibacillus multivorans]GEL76119.1 ribosomal large subunit pseudouridine synthase B [Tenuibacillus multivorans]SDN62808.1 23S rRNA pseudouridine2605 synthase [Tenuibacillus multivorans]